MRRRSNFGLVLAVVTALTACTPTGAGQPASTSALTPGGSIVTTLATSSQSNAVASTPAVPPVSSDPVPSTESSPAVTTTSSQSVATTGTSTPIIPTSSTVTSSPTAGSPTLTSPSTARASVPPVQTSGLSSAEIADRTAIQKIWVKYWEVTGSNIRLPANQRKAALATVAVEPHVTKLLEAEARFVKNGWDNYGTPGHRPYWGPPIAGADQAIMGDCMDFSHVGRLEVKSRKALTVGIARSNVRGIFERDSLGDWHVSGLQILQGTPC